MTSLAFILGVLPLVLATGAGSASQRAIGTGVMGGMVTGTALGGVLRAGVLRGGAQPVQGQRAPAQAAHACDKRALPKRRDGDARTSHELHKSVRSAPRSPALPRWLLAGCSLMPTYERPAAPVPAVFPGAQPASRRGNRRRPTLAWQDFFTDPRLQPADRDRAGQQPRPARGGAQHRAGARAVPHPARRPVPDGRRLGQRLALEPDPRRPRPAAACVDLLGRPRRHRLGARLLRPRREPEATRRWRSTWPPRKARKAAQISLIGAVANAWLTLLADDELLELTRQTLATREESLQAHAACASTTAWPPSSTCAWPSRWRRRARVAYAAAAAPARAGRERAGPAARRSRCRPRPPRRPPASMRIAPMPDAAGRPALGPAGATGPTSARPSSS